MCVLGKDRAPTLPENAAAVASMRVVLVVAAALVFLAGVQLFLLPTRTERYFAWTIASPMTASFLGAEYWSSRMSVRGTAFGARSTSRRRPIRSR